MQTAFETLSALNNNKFAKRSLGNCKEI
jgi:hypothetical protein